jgi:glycosyltransferase involved in cell wall biosynthesis
MSTPLDLTIVIPAKNEERNLPGCLESIGQNFASEIVVVDSSSTDRTEAITRDAGASYINFEWDGRFPKKRNWFLRNHTPKTNWVFFLDADEYLTPEFKAELRQALASTDHVGFWLSYSIYFLGRPLKGGYPLRKLPLFRVGAGEYERIDEEKWSKLDMEIHEHPVLEGSTGVISARIDHRDYRGVEHWVSKHNEYSSWEAGRIGKVLKDPEVRKQWTFVQKIKYRLIRTPLIGVAFFCGSYFLLGGFRDGARGFAFALLKMGYFTQVYCKIKEHETAKLSHTNE